MPYVPIYFSARLIDALYERRPVETLVLYVALTVGIVFLLSLVSAYLSSRRAVAYNELHLNDEWLFSEKAMQMAYASMEDSDVTLLRKRIAMESQTGYNIWNLYDCAEQTVSSMTRILLSISMTLSFFFLDGIPFLIKLGFVAGILFTILGEAFTTRRIEAIFSHFMETSVHLNTLYGKYYDYINHYSSGKDIRLYDMAESLLDFISGTMAEFHRSSLNLCRKQAAQKVAYVILNHVLKFCVYLIFLYATLLGQITIGSIAQYVSCVMLLLAAVSKAVSSIQTAFVNHTYLKRYFSYLDIPNPMYQGSLTVEKRDDNEYFVEFRDVSFRYPNTEAYALRHVNLKFKVGEKLAIVGRNGSGIEISGGEAQKIALARALYKDAPFLILDEPTAALDPVSEYEIYSKFNGIAGDKTAIYISHRLASCRFCDKIAVFDSGEIVQTGSHDTLIAQKGERYHELWNAQAQYYTDAAAEA